MTIIETSKRVLIPACVVLGLTACNQLDVNKSSPGTSQSPQHYGAAAGDQPLAPLSAA